MSLRKIETPEIFRDNIRKKLNEKLNNEKASLNLEKGIFNYVLKEAEQRKIVKKWDNKFFVQIYLSHLKSILNNLNKHWIDEVNNGTIKPHILAFMTHQEFNPEHWKDHIDRKIKRDSSKYTSNIEASTDMFTCKRCKSKRCTYYELQTRSADEPSTIFVSCLDCGKQFKR
jgi:DNA-directed RNA polymerase subunit M/transcription elongation factor TFIIS